MPGETRKTWELEDLIWRYDGLQRIAVCPMLAGQAIEVGQALTCLKVKVDVTPVRRKIGHVVALQWASIPH